MRLFKPFVGERVREKLIVLSLLFLAASPAYSKTLAGRLGVGFVNQFANSSSIREVPSISAKYGLTKDFNISLAAGFHTLSPTAFTVGAKVYRNIFFESNLNFYVALGLAALKGEKFGAELLGLGGAEFFIPGIDSLGLSFETGLSASTIAAQGLVLKTVGFSFLHAGMHFYF